VTVKRGDKADRLGFESAEDGTVYWTLSLYIEADKVAAALGKRPGERVEPGVFRRAQRSHLPSLALRNAIDPLMNDIADREVLGEVQEYLLAATEEDAADLASATEKIRRYEDLTFSMPNTVSWMTEGVLFETAPKGLDDDRLVRLRRFWLSHNNGAVSYHLSFSHFYGDYIDAEGEARSGHDPSTYYFLSMLQKLAAPKEYALDPEVLKPTPAAPEPFVTVFQKRTLEIDPLDRITVHPTGGEGEPETFWPFVKARFERDVATLFKRLASAGGFLEPVDGFASEMLDLVPFMEVPGLRMPQSRFMFMLHDERFFDRLMPLHPETGENAPRKLMVQQACYDPYQTRIRGMMEAAAAAKQKAVRLDPDYWDWVTNRPEYEVALAEGAFTCAASPTDGQASSQPVNSMGDLVVAMHAGACVESRKSSGSESVCPISHNIPAFEAGRADCLDYLFLAGFNQNIIDFMNQDTSEILDGIDPIYPDSSEQSDERFFVRYANHRAMITYVPKSRSLEIGNDYIGACPYAFLIHALALHNEFLAREHEAKSLARIVRIKAMIAGDPLPDTEIIRELQLREPLDRGDRFNQAEIAINQAKLAEFDQYEHFRYSNPFRYDTERVVFQKMEELRGVSRKTLALSRAIKSLEDHARDLQRRHQKQVEDAASRRSGWLNILLGGTGVFGAGQMIYWIGEKTAGDSSDPAKPLTLPFLNMQADASVGHRIMSMTEAAMSVALTLFILLLLWIGFVETRERLTTWLARRREPDYSPPRTGAP
jgi:hypothetical protein